MYPEKNMAQKDTRTPVFTAALFTMAKTTRKQPTAIQETLEEKRPSY